MELGSSMKKKNSILLSSFTKQVKSNEILVRFQIKNTNINNDNIISWHSNSVIKNKEEEVDNGFKYERSLRVQVISKRERSHAPIRILQIVTS